MTAMALKHLMHPDKAAHMYRHTHHIPRHRYVHIIHLDTTTHGPTTLKHLIHFHTAVALHTCTALHAIYLHECLMHLDTGMQTTPKHLLYHHTVAPRHICTGYICTIYLDVDTCMSCASSYQNAQT